MFAGAVGDALGANLEPFDTRTVHEFFDVDRPDYIEGDHPTGAVTDDTQMGLFTAEAVIWADRLARPFRHETEAAYLRWHATQTDGPPEGRGLVTDPGMRHRRSPDPGCLTACEMVAAGIAGDVELAVNDERSAIAVSRVAPVAVTDHPALYGATAAAVTHGDPTAIAAAAVAARIVGDLLDGTPLAEALYRVVAGDDNVDLDLWPDAPARLADAVAEVRDRIGDAVMSHHLGAAPSSPETFGTGDTAVECLCIAVSCAALVDRGAHPLRALAESVAHGGASASTGTVCGHLLGAAHGHEWLPSRLVKQLRERGTVAAVTAELVAQFCVG